MGMDVCCAFFSLQTPEKLLSFIHVWFLRPQSVDKHLQNESLFSQTLPVCITQFCLAYRILIHAGGVPPYPPLSLVLLPPLSWEIQMYARFAQSSLALSSPCHYGHLKAGHSQCMSVPSEGIFQGLVFPSQVVFWQPVSSTVAGYFQFCVGKHLLICDFFLTSAETSKHSDTPGLAILILICLRMTR